MESNLRNLRKEKGLTQMELARKSGVNRTIIARYETGVNTPNVKTLMRLAQALEVKADDIIGGERHGATA